METLEDRCLLAADILFFNDHVSGPATGSFVTDYAVNGDPAGFLRDSISGQYSEVALRISSTGAVFENSGTSPALGTDAHSLFAGKVDLSTGIGSSIALSGSSTYTHSFDRLSADKVYEFAGTVVRGQSSYTNRWTLVTLVGADSFAAAHSDGVGVVTTGLAPNQVALWTGANHQPDQGFVAQWTQIDPGLDGRIQIVSQQYQGPTPGVGSGDSSGASKGYGLTAVRLVETSPGFRVAATDPAPRSTVVTAPTSYTVDFNAPFDTTTVDAADLTVDGQPALAVEIIDSDTARFTLPATNATGLVPIEIAANAINGSSGLSLEAYEGSFVIVSGPGVVINEVHYDSGSDALPWEYVELLNSGSTTIDLSGWSLDNAVSYSFPAGTTLGPSEFLVIAQNPDSFTNHFGISSLGPFDGRLSNSGETIELVDGSGLIRDEVDYQLGFPWPTIGAIAGNSIQLINPQLANDVGGNWRSALATPGFTNLPYDNEAAPAIRQVSHSPKAPLPGQAVAITAKVTDPDGVQAVSLEYQLVNPGDYIEIDDPRYQTEWTSVAMVDNGTNGDTGAGDNIYTVVLPAELQTHRRLVRYRLTASDSLGTQVTAPFADDLQPNFAYFVYGETPDWTGADRPGVTEPVTYEASVLNSVPTYHLITTSQDHVNSQYLPGATVGRYNGSDYLWQGSLVYEGKVYDHIRYRARGGVWRYAMGKNMWKFDFNPGHDFQAQDAYGEEYDVAWKKLNLGALIQQQNKGSRGEQGLFEMAGFKLFSLADVEASNTHYVQFRIVENADENGTDQYSGDFQGLYLAVEQPDDQFLEQHDLPDGNLYKMEGGTGVSGIGGELKNQGDYPEPSDSSDLIDFKTAYENSDQTVAWWEQNFNLDSYYSYRSVAESIRHYDTSRGKNYYYYHNPETDQWQIVPWDLDLTWNGTANSIGEPFREPVLDIPEFETDYLNRMREIRDLLYNPDQTGAIIDEVASFVYTPGEPSLVDADRAMWDYNPIMSSGNINPGKAGKGYYYSGGDAIPRTDDFAGMIEYVKGYLIDRGNWIDANVLTNDDEVPFTPSIIYSGPSNFAIDSLSFTTNSFSDPNGDSFAAMEWRLGEVSNPDTPLHDPTRPWIYEIDSVWESGELTSFDSTIYVNQPGLKTGHTYRARLRMQDDDGNWSHWSQPVEFVAGPEPIPALAITELNYHPNNSTIIDEDDLEFVEVMNTGSTAIDLAGIQIADFASTPYVFPAGITLAAGETIVVPRSLEVFQTIYTGEMNLTPDGFGGRNLSNGGETISLRTPGGQVIQTFTYDDEGTWPTAPDGDGFSLELINPLADPTDATNWRASIVVGGTPGTAPPAPSAIAGDYDRNGTVETADMNLWRQTFGSTSELLADGNSNGRVDAADYTVWRDHLGETMLVAVASSLPAKAPAEQISADDKVIPNSTPYFRQQGSQFAQTAPSTPRVATLVGSNPVGSIDDTSALLLAWEAYGNLIDDEQTATDWLADLTREESLDNKPTATGDEIDLFDDLLSAKSLVGRRN